MKQYQHLNKEERFYIWNALRTGSSQKDVSATLGRHSSTISREIRRNTARQAKMYTFHWALELVKWRKQRTADTKYRKLSPELTLKIEQLIQKKWEKKTKGSSIILTD